MSNDEHLERRTYPPVGYCIYCRATGYLTKEHTIPYALGGTLVLPEASCKKCAKITGALEQKVLRGPIQQVRVFRGLPSRTKHKDAPPTKALTVLRPDGKKEDVEVGFAEAPVVYSFPIFDVPAYLRPEGYTKGIVLKGYATFGFGPTPDDVAKVIGADRVGWDENHLYAEFARMVAKIVYASAIGQALQAGIQSPFDGIPFVVPSILGEDDQIGRWVGTITDPPRRHENQLHHVQFGVIEDGTVVQGSVQIFADSGTPSYGVILGKTSVKLD